MLTDVPGISVGHWTDEVARTGCTVVLMPEGTVASGEVRGGAPASREFALLDPVRTVANVDGVVLTGGSAFGLATADGVMTWLEEQGRGYETRHGRVPIVVGLGLFDLGVGDPTVRPGAAQGRLAAEAAADGPVALGRVGAGTGATANKWAGADGAVDAGLGSATLRVGPVVVSALVAVNAVGAIDDGTSIVDPGPPARAARLADDEDVDGRANTTLGVVATNARLDKLGCHLLAQSAHDGLARALLPAHTAGDGDAVVAVATGAIEVGPGPEPQPESEPESGSEAAPEAAEETVAGRAPDVDLAHLRVLAQQVVAAAVRSLA